MLGRAGDPIADEPEEDVSRISVPKPEALLRITELLARMVLADKVMSLVASRKLGPLASACPSPKVSAAMTTAGIRDNETVIFKAGALE